jgi:orotidine-5'-phosphate decarboxylase
VGIIVDIDVADKSLRGRFKAEHQLPGLWGYKIGDAVLNYGMIATLSAIARKHNVMVDLKHHDVEGRIGRIVALYTALGQAAPKYLTISGACSLDALSAAVEMRGKIDIIVTTVLSDEDDDVEELRETAIDRTLNAVACHAQGVTCPAWLLPDIQPVKEKKTVIATGVVSKGVAARHHIEPRPVEFAVAHGATHVVVGTEVTAAHDPIKTLRELCARYETAQKNTLLPIG